MIFFKFIFNLKLNDLIFIILICFILQFFTFILLIIMYVLDFIFNLD